MPARLAALAALCLIAPAHAKPAPEFNGERWLRVIQAPAGNVLAAAKPRRAHPRARRGHRKPAPRHYPDPGVVTPIAQVIGGRPAGCPRRFCGCGASLHLFGRIIPALNLAANWLRFPRAAPAPGMVAARRGHVFVLKQHVAGDKWIVFDANSGRGRTRIHPRSISRYTIVNPHGRRA